MPQTDQQLPPYLSANEDLASRIARLLHAQPNPSRPPTWDVPPFYASNLRCTLCAQLVGPGIGAVNEERWGVTFTAQADSTAGQATDAFIVQADSLPGGFPQPFPVGLVGVLWVECQVGVFGTPNVAANAVRQARWSLLRNGQIVNGYARQIPGGITAQQGFSLNDLTAPLIENNLQTRCRTAAPLLLRENDTVEVIFSNDGMDGTEEFVLQAWGWSMPAIDAGPYFGAFFQD